MTAKRSKSKQSKASARKKSHNEAARADTPERTQAMKIAAPILPYRWQPGQSGNPTGGRRWATVHKEFERASLEIADAKTSLTNLAAAVDKVVAMGISGNIEALKLWFERLDGKVAQVVIAQGDVTHKYVTQTDADATE